jgi:hypothetical protein
LKVTKRRKRLNITKSQKAKKGRKIQYSMGKIRGKISSLRIRKGGKNSPGHSFKLNSVEKKTKMLKITKSWKKWKYKII